MPVDLTNCDREPIHIPGSIQPHGALTACAGADLTVVQVSENIASFFGAEPPQVLGSSLASWLTPDSAAQLTDIAAAGFPRERNPLSVRSRNGRALDAIGHRATNDRISIVEFEPDQEHEHGFDVRMRASVRRLQDVATRAALLDTAATEVRKLTGFDRVMVYQFDPDWHGHVVAEAKRDDLETFLGLHYPASDIPAQARRLYTLNWLRIIPDVGYVPARLLASSDASHPLDLSFAVLRSVSPIHIEYLRNMGVTASMSVSLFHNGALIGLIACHHYSGPHYVRFVTRETAEYLGQVLSWHLSSLDAQERAEKELITQRAKSRMVSVLDHADSIAGGLSQPTILELTEATGAAIIYDSSVHLVGRTPDEAFVRSLIPLLAEQTKERVFATDHLAEWVSAAGQARDDVAAGVLAVDIARDLGEYVIWFRPATERTVDWAGDPRKQTTAADDGSAPRLSPRGSFALWREIVRGRAIPWEPWHVAAASELRTLLLGRIRKRAAELQRLNLKLAAADRSKDEFVATISHELRTPLNAILGWVQMLQAEGVPRERQLRALATIERNARSQAQLIEDLLDVSRMLSGTLRLTVEPVSVAAIVEQLVESMRLAAEAKAIRVHTMLDSSAAVLGDQQRLLQVVSNLLSNAVKFTPKHGKVEVAVERLASSVEIRVADTGQGIEPEFLPHIFERFQQADRTTTRRTSGLGLGLAIVKHIVELHGGRVDAFSAGSGQGSTFTVRLPLSIAARAPIASVVDSNSLNLPCPPELDGVRVVIVDDDVDARELLVELFTRCKAQAYAAESAAAGFSLVKRERPDVLISDIGMPDEDGYSLIARVRALAAEDGGRTPAVALTAYARPDDRARILLAGFQNHLAKPVEPLEILAVAASLVAMRGR